MKTFGIKEGEIMDVPKARYEIEGRKYFSVTQILQLISKDKFDNYKNASPANAIHLENRQIIGTMSHFRIQRHLANLFGLPPAQLSMTDLRPINHFHDELPLVREDCTACKRKMLITDTVNDIFQHFLTLMKEHELQPIYTEKLLFDPVLSYAGTMDYYGIFDGKKVIIDWKTFRQLFQDNTYGAQLSAYAHILRKQHVVDEVIILSIHETEGYKIIPLIEDWDTFERLRQEFFRQLKEQKLEPSIMIPGQLGEVIESPVNKQKLVLDIIDSLTKKDPKANGGKWKDIVREANTHNIPREEIENIVADLFDTGQIYEPYLGTLKLI